MVMAVWHSIHGHNALQSHFISALEVNGAAQPGQEHRHFTLLTLLACSWDLCPISEPSTAWERDKGQKKGQGGAADSISGLVIVTDTWNWRQNVFVDYLCNAWA